MLHPHIEKQRSPIEGFGLFAARPISRGTRIWELDPDERRFTWEQLQKLPSDLHRLLYQSGDVFILCSDDSEYMNHSCDPNVGWDGDEAMIALRDIRAGEEITYDYATSEIDPRFRPQWTCRCGSPNCRQTITNRDCLDPAFQKRHQGRLPSWTLALIKGRTTGTEG